MGNACKRLAYCCVEPCVEPSDWEPGHSGGGESYRPSPHGRNSYQEEAARRPIVPPGGPPPPVPPPQPAPPKPQVAIGDGKLPDGVKFELRTLPVSATWFEYMLAWSLNPEPSHIHTLFWLVRKFTTTEGLFLVFQWCGWHWIAGHRQARCGWWRWRDSVCGGVEESSWNQCSATWCAGGSPPKAHSTAESWLCNSWCLRK